MNHWFYRGRFGLVSVCEEKSLGDGSMKLDGEGGLGATTQITGSFGFAAAGYVVEE